MRRENKNTVILILLLLLGASGIINYFLSLTPTSIGPAPPFKPVVIIGYGTNPSSLDPIDTTDDNTRNFQRQITQSLIEYDLSSNPQFQLKPVLAEYWIWESLTRISFKLRENVYFHDGSRMTAEDVKWNFERIMWFCNATGTLPANQTSWEAKTSSIFYLANGTFIFHSFEANDNIDPLNFTINLNNPFSPLLDLLTFGAANIISPRSSPKYRYLELENEELIGTGPYKFQYYFRDIEISLERWDMYWAFPGYYEDVQFRIIEDDTQRITVAYAGEFDYISGVPMAMLPTFCLCGPPPFTIVDVGEDPCYFYLELYCGPRDYNGNLIFTGDYQYQRNNATLRRALTLAINYSYIYEEIQSGYAVEGTTAIPRETPGHNSSVIQASDSFRTFEANVAGARALIASMYPTETFGLDTAYPGATEVGWSSLSVKTLEINRHYGSIINLRLNQLIENNFDLIGIDINETIREYDDYKNIGENTPWKMDLGYIGLCPDYLNPYNMIDPLFNLQSEFSFSRINDTSPGGLTDMMRDALNEVNRSKQLEIYGNIQSYIFDVNRPITPASHAHISGWSYLTRQAHMPELKGVNYNIMEIFECWTWYYEE